MLKHASYFVVIGGLMLLLSTFVEPPVPKPLLEVPMATSAPTQAEMDLAIEEAILLDQAKHYGWDRTDPVVFAHLVKNMRFVDGDTEASDIELFRRGLELGLHERDPVVRARMLQRAGSVLASVPADEAPTDAMLETHRTKHSERFSRPGRVTFNHVFLSRDRRGDTLEADAARVGERLAAGDLDAQASHKLGDPLPGVRALQVQTPQQILHAYGVEVRSALSATADAGTSGWQGPLKSVYGVHFVRVVERDAPYVPPLADIVSQVRADKMRELKAEVRSRRLQELRDQYDVHVTTGQP